MKLRLPFFSMFLFASGWFTQAHAINPEYDQAFDSTFYHIYTHTASIDIPGAIMAVDSLFQNASTDVHRIRALMLIGDMYHRVANRDSVITYAARAARIAERSRIYGWQARIYGVLSTQYREMGLLGQGRKYLTLGLEASDRMETPEAINQFKGQVYQEMGFYAMAEDNYKQAIVHFKQASLRFEEVPPSAVRSFGLVQNDERIGVCYIRLGQLDSAGYYLHSALHNSDEIADTNTPLKGLVYSGIGRLFVLQGNHAEASDYLNKALEIAETTKFPNLLISVYKNLADYYRAVGDMEAYVEYNEQFLEVTRVNQANHRVYTDMEMVKAQAQLEREMATRKQIALLVGGVLLLVGGGMVIHFRKQRKKHRRFRTTIERLEESINRTPKDPVPITNQPMDSERELMPEATRLELLDKLKQFEASTDFTDRSISIAMLAARMKTNTKYLSHVINNDKQKDFNTYINSLRVNYVISRMNTDPQYLKYKISYMAEDAGFSSHGKFTTVFKNITGLSPSMFIEHLKKEQLKVQYDTPGVKS